MDTDFKFLDFKKEKNNMNLTKEKARRMLNEMYETAFNVALTRAPVDGARVFAIQYKKICEHAVKNGWVDQELVIDIDEINNITFSEMGCAASTLASLLYEEKDDDEEDDDEE